MNKTMTTTSHRAFFDALFSALTQRCGAVDLSIHGSTIEGTAGDFGVYVTLEDNGDTLEVTVEDPCAYRGQAKAGHYEDTATEAALAIFPPPKVVEEPVVA